MIRIVALMLLLVFAGGGWAGEDEPAADEPDAPAAVESAPEATLAGWLVIAACLVVSVSAGGFTFLCYLRRRDALSTLAAIETRYRSRSSSDFM